jgi:heat-inducible transcriptional repressor
MGSSELSVRSGRLLATLVREYIETGEPVSSQVLARESGLGVSSATVRNALAQLEAAGYVHQPHTSAGRVPTDRGYRFFVDLLLGSRRPGRLPASVENELRQKAERSLLLDDLLADVSHLVSRMSRHVGFALCEIDGGVLQRLEFVPLAGPRVLVVIVFRGNQVTQKVIDTGEELRQDELVQAANYLNTEFAGLPLSRIRDCVLERLHQERTLYDQLLARALRLASSTLQELPAQQSLFVDGASSLIDASAPHERVSLATLRALIEMMEEKERLVRLLNRCIDGPGLTIVIGAEHTSPDLRPFSLVASTSVDGPAIRTVGVIGPTRMHYSRAITVVDGTTLAVTRVLRSGN